MFIKIKNYIMKKFTFLFAILLFSFVLRAQTYNYLYPSVNLAGSPTFPTNSLSGTSAFTNVTVVPNHSWSVTTSNNKIQEFENVQDPVEMLNTNAWGTKYGNLTITTPCIKTRHDGNNSSIGAALGTPITTIYTFPTPAKAYGWGFLISDIDVDQVDVSATKPDGTQFTKAEINSWFKGLGDADNADGVTPPCWDATNATVVGSAVIATPCVRKTTLGDYDDVEGPYAYFEPNKQVKSLTFVYHNLQADLFPSSRYFIAAARVVNVTGTIFNDIDGTTDGNIDGTGIGLPSSTQLYAYLTNSAGLIVDSALVKSNGTYTFNPLFSSAGTTAYRVVVTTAQVAIGTSNPAITLPAGWSQVGENIGTTYAVGNNDGNGAANQSIGFNVGSSNITNVNFAIQRNPESAVNLQSNTGNPGGFNSTSVPAGAFQTNNVGSTPNTGDYDGGTVTNIRITAFPSNANSITINGTVYTNGGTCPPSTTCTAWPAGGVVVPYTNGTGPSQAISVDPIEGNVDVVIPFVARDNSGKEDPTPGSVTIPFRTVTLSGTVFNDLNGNATTNGTPQTGEAVINGTNTGAGLTAGQVLYANLIDANGIVIATAPISSTGTYSFPNVPQSATGLTVQLSTNQGTVGIAKPATTLPNGWVSTGENKNGQAGTADATTNTEIPITTTTTNITTQNFGIQQVPQTATNVQAGQTNPGGTINVTVNPSFFQNSNVGANPNTQDFNGGTVASIRLTAFPTNATSITVNGVTYTASSPIWPANGGAGIVVPYTNGVGPTQAILVDPINGIVNVNIPFAAIDNAGIQDPTPGYVQLNFDALVNIPISSFVLLKNNSNAEIEFKLTKEALGYTIVIERSENGNDFKSIATINGSNSLKYNYTDVSPVANTKNYYRIKVVAPTGEYVNSETKHLNFGKETEIGVFPIPAKNEVNISFTAAQFDKTVNIFFYNASGKLMLQKQINKAIANQKLDVSNFASGNYFLKIISADGKQINKNIVITK
jgi:hypothetical protein